MGKYELLVTTISKFKVAQNQIIQITMVTSFGIDKMKEEFNAWKLKLNGILHGITYFDHWLFWLTVPKALRIVFAVLICTILSIKVIRNPAKLSNIYKNENAFVTAYLVCAAGSEYHRISKLNISRQ